ncbi:MAG TPA: DUF6691 family protein [Pseudomonadales bacterium]
MMSLPIVLGLLFGVALQRVGATNPENIINMLCLKDLHLMKTILFAVGFSCLGLFIGLTTGFVDPAHLSVKEMHFGVLLGGGILGVGFALAGYCPGTGLGAMAEGRRDALVFVLGGLLGAALYMAAHASFVDAGVLASWLGGKVTVAQTGRYAVIAGADIPGWLVAGAMGLILMTVAAMLPRYPR